MNTSASQAEYRRKIDELIFLPLSYIAVAGVGLTAALAVVSPGGSLGILEAVLTIGFIANLFGSVFGKISNCAATHVVFGLLGLFLTYGAYAYSHNDIPSYLLMAYPLLVAIGLGIRKSVYYILPVVLGIIPLVFGVSLFDANYESARYIELAAMIVAVSALCAYYELVVEKHIGLHIKDHSEPSKAHDTATELRLQVSQRERAEQQMADALKKLGEKNQELERTQAIDEATISSIGEAVLIVNPRGVILRANPSSGRVLRLNQEELINQRIDKNLTFAHQGKEDVILKESEIAIAQSMQHRSINEATYQVQRPDGTTFYAQMTASPLVVGGVVYGAVVVLRDVTMEVTVDRAKSEFVSIASHQLRTPLSTINWYLEMVLAGDFGVVNDEQKEFINEAAQAAKRMGSLLNALLNASRIDVGVVAIEPEMTDIRDVIKSVLVDLESKMNDRQVSVTVAVDDAIKPVMLDPRIMEIIFLNLISNAVKYSPKGSIVEVSVTLEPNLLAISVTDHGYGIPANAQEKIFTKMFRAQNAIDHEPDGNGLGMYIVKSILDTIGGTIAFVSKEGAGTTFTVRLSKDGMKQRSGSKQLAVQPDM